MSDVAMVRGRLWHRESMAIVWSMVVVALVASPGLAWGQPQGAPAPAAVITGQDGAEMVLVPAGAFWMGSDQAEMDRFVEACKKYGKEWEFCSGWGQQERPRHRVFLDAFHIDRYEVTNALFERFVQATNLRTSGEANGRSMQYYEKDGKYANEPVNGASWRMPTGPGSSAVPDHPVVQVSWHEADAYCRWAGNCPISRDLAQDVWGEGGAPAR